MENSSVETGKIIIDATISKYRENLDTAKISKNQVILLLKKHGVKDTETLEAPDVKKEDIISTLRKAKVKVPEAFFKHLAAELELPFLKQAEIKKFCKVSHECRFLTVLPYRIIEEYLILPMQITETTAKIAARAKRLLLPHKPSETVHFSKRLSRSKNHFCFPRTNKRSGK